MKKIIIMICILMMPIGVYAKEKVTFVKCVDGDTAKFKVNGSVKTVRFLAIDTPEVKHPKKKEERFGKEASKYTCNSLKNAMKIELEYDKNSTKTDKYDRLLAWVFVDGELLQEKIISKGYAKVAYLYDDYKYTARLQKAEKVAKKNKLGVHSDSSTLSESDLDNIFKIIKKLLKMFNL